MGRRAISILLLITGLAAACPAEAHLVPFEGATAVTSWNQPMMSDQTVTHALAPRLALTGRFFQARAPEGVFRFSGAQGNALLKRWNLHDAQANLIAYGGGGVTTYRGRDGGTPLVGLEADAESRRFYGLIRAEAMRPSVGPDWDYVEGRIGLAPYEAEFNELASWLMFQVQWQPRLQRNVMITPMARFFYRSVLWETGVSLNGDWMMNLMFRF